MYTDGSPAGRLELARRLWGWGPHEGQRALLLAEAGVKVAACGRRWGKTEALAVDAAICALTRPGLSQMVVAPTYDQSRILFDRTEALLWEAAEKAGEAFPVLARMAVTRSPYPRIALGKGGITARTASREGRGLRGQGVDRVIVDEAAFVDDGVVKEVVMPMLATTPGGGELVLLSTPFGRRGVFWEAFDKGQRPLPEGGPGRYWSCRFPTSQNPRVDAGYLAEQRAEMTERAFRTEYEAEFVEDGGVVFPEEEIRAAVVADDHTGPQKGCRYVAGIDFGRRTDYTVVVVLQVGASPAVAPPAGSLAPVLRVVHLARMQGLSWSGQVERVRDLLARWACVRVATDRTGVGDALSENLAVTLVRQRMGVALDEFVFTAVTKAVLIDGVALALSQRRLQFPAHPDLLHEMRSFVAKPPSAAGGRERLEAARGHDDTVCALALAVHAAGAVAAPMTGSRLGLVGGPRQRVTFSAEREVHACSHG